MLFSLSMDFKVVISEQNSILWGIILRDN